MSVVARLPWPAREVWPNFRQSHHWRKYARPVKLQRAEAYGLALAAGARPLSLAVIPIAVHFAPPDRRHRDDDGMVGAFKSARDGIADALRCDDRDMRATYVFGDPDPAKRGFIEVTIG